MASLYNQDEQQIGVENQQQQFNDKSKSISDQEDKIRLFGDTSYRTEKSPSKTSNNQNKIESCKIKPTQFTNDSNCKHNDDHRDTETTDSNDGSKFLMHQSGRGKFAEVDIHVTLYPNQILAIKRFHNQKDYQREYQNYYNLLGDYGKDQLSKLIILPCDHNEELSEIHFTPGVCSLQELVQDPQFQLTVDQAVYIFMTLLEFIILMSEKGYCHSDIKPQNTQFVMDKAKRNCYMLKMIDFGALTKNEEKNYAWTSNYFKHPYRIFKDKTIVFQNMEERFKNEFYSVLRTFQYIMLGKGNQKQFHLKEKMSQDEQIQRLIEIQEIIRSKYSNLTEDNLLIYILNFIQNNGIEEKYQFVELKKQLNYLKDNSNDSQQFYQDKQQQISNLIEKKYQIRKQRRDPLALFSGIKRFIYQMGSKNDVYSDPFNLIEKLTNKITKVSTKNRNIVIIGESGSGKTLLLYKLENDLRQFKVDYYIVYLNLSKLSNPGKKDIDKRFLKKINMKIDKKQNQQKQNLLLLLDSYDELNHDNLNISKVVLQKFSNYQKIITIMTSRPRHVTDEQLNNVFSNPYKIYICPFDKEQINSYIQNILQNNSKDQNYYQQNEVLDSTEEYIEFLNEFQSLDLLCTLPFTLQLVTYLIPQLKKIMQNQEQEEILNYTKYKIYDIFLQDYYKKQNKKLQLQDEKYKDYFYKNDIGGKFYQVCNRFNQLCSWQMLQNNRLELCNSEILSLINIMCIPPTNQQEDRPYILQEVSPAADSDSNKFAYIHKSFYEFYIAQSIIEESLSCRQMFVIDQNNTIINIAFLAYDLDIIGWVVEHVAGMPVIEQHKQFFETWYRTVLLTRQIKSGKIIDQQDIDKLKILGSNCLNLMAGFPRCDLKDRNFSDCAIPRVCFYKRDLSGCKFIRTEMPHCILSDARLNNCIFDQSNLSHLSYGRWPDLKGLSQYVFNIAFSVDGEYIASGSADRSVKLYSVSQQKILCTLQGHNSYIGSIAISADSKYIASGSGDKSIKIWSLENQSLLETLTGHTAPILCLTFTSDSKYLASCGHDHTIKLWSVGNWKDNSTLRGHSSSVYNIAFSADNQMLASGSWDKEIKVWDIKTKQQTFILKGHTSDVFAVAFSQCGKYLASGSGDTTVKLWDISRQDELATLKGHKDKVLNVVFSPDGKYLVSGSNDTSIKLWNLQKRSEQITLIGHKSVVNTVSISGDGKFIASASGDETIKLWSIDTKKEVFTLQGYRNNIFSVSFTPKYLASASGDSSIKLWNIESQKEHCTLQGHSNSVNSLAFSPSYEYLVSGSSDCTVKLWKINSHKDVQTLQKHNEKVTCVAFSPNGNYVASASMDKTVKIWNIAQKKEIACYQEHTQTVNSIAFSPDGKYLASGSSDATANLWSLQSYQKIITFISCGQAINSVAFSPDSSLIACGNSDSSVEIWNVQQKKILFILNGHNQSVNSVAFSPDNQFLATCSNDKLVILWNLEKKEILKTFNGHIDSVLSIAFSPDGQYFASCSQDGTINLSKTEILYNFNQQNQGGIEAENTSSDNCVEKLFPQKQEQYTKLGAQDVSFDCRDAVFRDCIFSDQKEAMDAENYFRSFNFKLFSDSQYLKQEKDAF